MLTCKKCERDKETTDFYKNKVECKECWNKRVKEYRKKHPEKRTEEKRGYNRTHRKQRDLAIKKWVNSTPLGALYTLRKHARYKKIDLNLSKEDFKQWWASQPQKCAYCNKTLEETKGRGHSLDLRTNRLILDRKDYRKDYLIDNLVFSCLLCSTVKSNRYTFDEMKKIGLTLI